MQTQPVRIVPGASPAAIADLAELGLQVVRHGSFMVLLPDEENDKKETPVCKQ